MSAINDPIGDMLTRIRNGYAANKKVISCHASKALERILDVLKTEGYIRGHKRENVSKGIDKLLIELKYYEGSPVIKKLQRVSTPGRRVYTNVSDMPKFMGGLGTFIVSTPKGIMTDHQAREATLGGELICQVF